MDRLGLLLEVRKRLSIVLVGVAAVHRTDQKNVVAVTPTMQTDVCWRDASVTSNGTDRDAIVVFLSRIQLVKLCFASMISLPATGILYSVLPLLLARHSFVSLKKERLNDVNGAAPE